MWPSAETTMSRWLIGLALRARFGGPIVTT
jgi:hypothetical protein